MSPDTVSLLAAATAGLLSFVSFGIIWAGVNQWIQAGVVFAYLALSFAATKKTKSRKMAIGAILASAAPIGGIITMFRDKNDSHLFGISLVASWVAAVFLGAWRAGTGLRQR